MKLSQTSDRDASRRSHHGPRTEAATEITRPRGASPGHGWLWWICHAVLWLLTIGLFAAALLRVFYHDGNHPLVWINAFTRYVYLPAYACLAWALSMRRWLLALLSLVVVGFHVGWNLPDFARVDRIDVPTESSAAAPNQSSTVRIFFANVRATNQHLEPIWKEIEAAQPDVVVLAECSSSSDKSFRRTPALAPYIDTKGRRRSQIGEVRIYSKLPIKSETQIWLDGRVVQKVDVQVGSQSLRVIGIHAPRPQPPEYDYFGYWKKVVPSLLAEPGPVVIVGDFNATQHSLVYKQLEDGGLRSAHEDRGRGYASTWPNGSSLLPPIRIDQAFLSSDVECLRVAEGVGEGSDHKPLVLDVALRNRTPPSSTIPAE